MKRTKTDTIKIGKRRFTGFHGGDWQNLQGLSHGQRVRWLKFRFSKVCLRPLNILLTLEKEAFIWLVVFDFTCSAINGLASFEFQGGDGDMFRQFVTTHFKRLRTFTTKFNRPHSETEDDAAAALWKWFRCGISHGLAIEWGSISSTANYVERRGLSPRKFMVIDPKEYIRDFKQACNDFFREAATWDGTPKGNIFKTHFENTFLVKGNPAHSATTQS